MRTRSFMLLTLGLVVATSVASVGCGDDSNAAKPADDAAVSDAASAKDSGSTSPDAAMPATDAAANTDADAGTLDASADDAGADLDAAVDPDAKFGTLADLLADPAVKAAIARLPAGTGVKAGAYYQGRTPKDISGTWSTECCGGTRGTWPPSGSFFGTLTYDVVSKTKVDLVRYESDFDIEDGTGSFIVGTGNQVTVFLQLAVTCVMDQRHVRAVAVDRFIYTPTGLTEYVRSYSVLARTRPSEPATCFADPIGSGEVSTAAVFAKKN